MQIRLYNWAGDPRVIDKPLTAEPNLTLTGTLREECRIEAPSILIQSDPRGQNYAYIPEFGRYYFIEDITAERNAAFRLDLRVDVLKSFASRILALNVHGIRSSIVQTPYIPDPQAPIETRMIVDPMEGDEIGPQVRSSMILVTVG